MQKLKLKKPPQSGGFFLPTQRNIWQYGYLLGDSAGDNLVLRVLQECPELEPAVVGLFSPLVSEEKVGFMQMEWMCQIHASHRLMETSKRQPRENSHRHT